MTDDHSPPMFTRKPPAMAIAALVIAATVPAIGQAREYFSPSRPPNPNEPRLGAYACTVKNAVAIKGERGKRVASVLSDQPTFNVTLKERDDGLVANRSCEENRPGKPAKAGAPPQFGSDHEWWYSCLSGYALELPKSKGGLKLRGDGRHLFMDQTALASFQLRDDLAYVFTYPDLGGALYLEEGQCRLDQPRKTVINQ